MNIEQKDKGLKRAVKEQPAFRLPSNFTFRTMQKVEEAMLLREKRTERRTLWATIAASVLLAVSGIVCLLYYWGDSLKRCAQALFRPDACNIEIPSFYMLLVGAFTLCLLFDQWMRKQYFKRHP